MANIYIGSDGVPVEQDEDGAFYVNEPGTSDEFIEDSEQKDD